MEVFELKLKVFLLKDIAQEEALNQISAFIDETLSKNKDFTIFHQNNQYKNYNFCSFYPMAEKGIYKKHYNYNIKLRTIDANLAKYFSQQLVNHSNHIMKGLICEIRIIPKYLIEKVYSLTPVLLKDEAGYWKKHLSIDDFENRIRINLIKKFNIFTGDKLDEDFQLYNSIKLLNKVPIKIPYKGIHLLGDKIELQVADHATAQKLIYMGLGTGLGESNARGNGFINYKYYQEV